jgi:alpha-D-ribose 1-methylphosphonate 5-triphosphate synthase subunit PhnH
MSEHGFQDPAVDSAHAFRAIMGAMSRPGSILDLSPRLTAPRPLFRTTAAAALTLCDFQAAIWIAPALRSREVETYLRFHTGASLTDRPDEAQFVLLAAEEVDPDIQRFAQGTHEYPDRSATLLIQVDGFGGDDVELTGPGIRSASRFAVEGLGPSFWAAMAENHARFPVGVDVIFTSPSGIAALPRSTAIPLKENA